MNRENMFNLKYLIRDVSGFPKPDILFRDITPLLSTPTAFKSAIETLASPFNNQSVDTIIGIEALGFVVASALAYHLDAGLVLIRKANKLPCPTYGIAYEMGYGKRQIEVHRDTIQPKSRVLLVDDVLATGSTAHAAINLIKNLDIEIIGLGFLVELEYLKGRANLAEYTISSVVKFSS